MDTNWVESFCDSFPCYCLSFQDKSVTIMPSARLLVLDFEPWRERQVGTFADDVGMAHPTPDSQGIEFRSSRDFSPMRPGSFSDVSQSHYGDSRVAIKTLRIYSADSSKEIIKLLRKRVQSWKNLSHPNISPFVGVNLTQFHLSLAYHIWPGGNIKEHAVSHPNLSRLSMLLDVVEGLKHLHDFGIVHGNLSSANVLVDMNGSVRLTGYGLAPIISGPGFTTSATPFELAGNYRWMSPELLNPSETGVAMGMVESKSADIYAFGMLAVEIFTSREPFSELRDGAVILHVLKGGRPEFPANGQEIGLTVQIWDLLSRCWDSNPKKRPMMKEVARRWEKFTQDGNNTKEESPSLAGWGVEACAKPEAAPPHASDLQRIGKHGRKWFCGLI